MNKQEYEDFLKTPAQQRCIGVNDLINRQPRTLIYGYTTNRDTFHVYLGHDQLIHVLVYSDLPDKKTGDAPKFLILGHSCGLHGGVEENASFVPSKRVYPESCDLEFCRLLRNQGVYIPFTTFNDTAHEHRVAQHDGFAGHVHEDGGVVAVDVHDALVEKTAATGELAKRAMTARVILVAARHCRVYAQTLSTGSVVEYVTIAESGKEAVLEHAASLLRSLPDSPALTANIQEHLIEAAFANPYAPVLYERTAYAETMQLDIGTNGTALRTGESLTCYQTTDEKSHWQQALVGRIFDRPFIAITSRTDQAVIRYSQFGEDTNFVEQNLRMYGFATSVNA